MIKSNFLFFIFNYYPIILNILILITITIPSKNNKSNPITLTLLLIFITFLISLKINYLINSWSSYILFLIIIGGLIIIFIYIVRVANNELFLLNYKFLIINLLKIIPLIIIFLLINPSHFINNNNNTNLWFDTLINNFSLDLYEPYLIPFNDNILFIINYLFYSIICIINICYKFKSPLRQLFF